MTQEEKLKLRLDQAAWLCERFFDHTADVLLYWDDPNYDPMPAPQDCEVIRVARSGIFPAGPS